MGEGKGVCVCRGGRQPKTLSMGEVPSTKGGKSTGT